MDADALRSPVDIVCSNSYRIIASCFGGEAAFVISVVWFAPQVELAPASVLGTKDFADGSSCRDLTILQPLHETATHDTTPLTTLRAYSGSRD
jgi:hypothetical protein